MKGHEDPVNGKSTETGHSGTSSNELPPFTFTSREENRGSSFPGRDRGAASLADNEYGNWPLATYHDDLKIRVDPDG